MLNSEPETYLDGLFFPEALRWHDGALWFSDVFGGQVLRAQNGIPEVVAEVPDLPAGLGWLPDGTTLVVSCRRRLLLSISDHGRVETYADLGSHIAFDGNDLVVDRQGRAYLGNYGFDPTDGGTPASTRLIRIDPDGVISETGPPLIFPNGMVLFNDDRELAIAETFADRLTIARVRDDGGLRDPVVVRLPDGCGPDGIAIDADGAFWVACAFSGEAIRVTRSGQITNRLAFPGEGVYCCVLGGPDGRTLFVAIASTDEEVAARQRTGRIVSFRVETAAPSTRRSFDPA